MVMSVPIEFAPPKYAQIVNTLQARIEDGAYAAGTMLPSETDLMGEFGVSRPTVVRAFEVLRQDGWIDTRQGKGRFVRGKPPQRGMPEHVAAVLAGEVDARVRLLNARQVPAPPRAAWALGIDEGTPVMLRRWLVVVDGIGPVELCTAYAPVDVAEGTRLGEPELLPEGLVRHLADRKRVQFDQGTQRISARPATTEESRLLEVGRRECMLTMLLALYDRERRPVVVVDVVMPPSRHELADAFPVL
jgi:GntR family transcriptional regulator